MFPFVYLQYCRNCYPSRFILQVLDCVTQYLVRQHFFELEHLRLNVSFSFSSTVECSSSLFLDGYICPAILSGLRFVMNQLRYWIVPLWWRPSLLFYIPRVDSYKFSLVWELFGRQYVRCCLLYSNYFISLPWGWMWTPSTSCCSKLRLVVPVLQIATSWTIYFFIMVYWQSVSTSEDVREKLHASQSHSAWASLNRIRQAAYRPW